jgi:uncharacterized membrane protein
MSATTNNGLSTADVRLAPVAQYGRRLFELGAYNGAHRVALRAGVSIGIPLLVLWAIGRVDLSLYATFGAFTALYGRAYSPVPRMRMQASAGLMLVSAVVLGTAVGISPMREWLVVPVVALAAGAVAFLSDALNWHPPGPLFAVFAIAGCASVPATAGRLPLALVVAASSAAFSLAVSASGLARPGVRKTPAEPWVVSFRAAAQRPGEFAKVAQFVCAVLVAGVIPTATGLGHPYWSMVAAVAALSAADAVSRAVRATHRVVGTLLGVLIAAGILSLGLPPLATIAAVIVLQICAELFAGRNYGLTVAFVTPLALAMVELVHPIPVGTLVVDRTLETIIGAIVGLSIAIAATLLRTFSAKFGSTVP